MVYLKEIYPYGLNELLNIFLERMKCIKELRSWFNQGLYFNSFMIYAFLKYGILATCFHLKHCHFLFMLDSRKHSI